MDDRYDSQTLWELKQLIDPNLYDERDKFVVSSGDAAWFIGTNCNCVAQFVTMSLAFSEDYIPKKGEEGSFLLSINAFKKVAEHHFTSSPGYKYIQEAFNRCKS